MKIVSKEIIDLEIKNNRLSAENNFTPQDDGTPCRSRWLIPKE